MTHLHNNSNNSTNLQSQPQFSQLTQLTPNLEAITTKYATNRDQSNSWKTPQIMIQDIKQVQPQIEYLADLYPAQDQRSFDKFCKNLNIQPLRSAHSIDNLTINHLKKLLNMNPKKK
eukprot:330348_1